VEEEILRHKRDLGLAGAEKVPSAFLISESISSKVRALRHPLTFYFASAILCVAALAFMFGSWTTFAVYLAFGFFLWWWSHQFHLSRSGILKPFVYLGSLLLVLYALHAIFRDLLGVVFLALYAIAFVIAGVLYLYHLKRGLYSEMHSSFPRTFLVVFYSHVIAFSSASLIGYLLSGIVFPDRFVSIMYVLLVWVLPCLLVYFFLTKFLYLRFFDRVHIKRDVLKSLDHGVAYAVVFIVILMLAYILTAFQLAGMERAAYADVLKQASSEISVVSFDMSAADDSGTDNILGTKVARDVISIADEYSRDVRSAPAGIMTAFSFADYVSDEYFAQLVRNRILISSVSSKAYGISMLASDLVRENSRLKQEEASGRFFDGTDDLDTHLHELRVYMEAVYVPYVEPYQFARLGQKIDEEHDSYSGLIADGELVDLDAVSIPEFYSLLPKGPRFAKAAYEVLYHTKVFRDIAVFAFRNVVMQAEDTIEPEAYRLLGDMGGPESSESARSAVLRYRTISQNHEAARAIGS
ncbi:hypothetical protein KY363_08340, partial [Candidatus Woesearchaeota archaeon]|nr:hypothetical protein [Candidatus Woesearchaeota archaeon]